MMSDTEKANKALALASLVSEELVALSPRGDPAPPTGFQLTSSGWLRFHWAGLLLQIHETERSGIEVEQVAIDSTDTGHETALSALVSYYLRDRRKMKVRENVYKAG